MALSPKEADREIGHEWFFRAWAERESTLRFERLHGALVERQVPEGLREACQQAAEDERRHAQICAELGAQFCDEDPYRDMPMPASPVGPKKLSPGSRLLYEIVAFCCVTESMNAALLMTLHQTVSHQGVRETAHALLVDEVQHAKFGWAYLAYVQNRREDVGFLAPYVGDMIRASASENLTDLSRLCQSWSDPDRGYLSAQTRIEIFSHCLEDVIFPGLEMHGVETTSARHWLDTQTWYDERAGD